MVSNQRESSAIALYCLIGVFIEFGLTDSEIIKLTRQATVKKAIKLNREHEAKAGGQS